MENRRDCKFEIFIKENKEFLNNPVIKDFLSKKENYLLLKQSICYPTIKNQEKLDEAFRAFYFSIRFTSYISSTLYFHGINLDKKIRETNFRFPMTLDQPVKEDSETSAKELAVYHENFEIASDNILDYITDSKLYQALRNLTLNQREILYLVYIKGWTDSEVSIYLKKSQQAVSKSRNKAIKKVRKYFEENSRSPNQ